MSWIVLATPNHHSFARMWLPGSQKQETPFQIFVRHCQALHKHALSKNCRHCLHGSATYRRRISLPMLTLESIQALHCLYTLFHSDRAVVSNWHPWSHHVNYSMYSADLACTEVVPQQLWPASCFIEHWTLEGTAWPVSEKKRQRLKEQNRTTLDNSNNSHPCKAIGYNCRYW